MADSDNSSGGLMGLDPDLLMNLGFGLMSAGHFGSNPGQAMSGALQNYYATKQAKQQLGMNQLQMQQMMARMPAMKAFYEKIGGLLGDPVPAGQDATQNALPGGAAPVVGGTGTSAAPPGIGAPMPPQQGGAPAAPQMPSSVPSIPGAPQLLGRSPPISAGLMSLPQAPSMPPAASMPAAAQPSGGGLLSDPMKLMQLSAVGDMAGVPGATSLGELAKTQLQYDPRIATQMALGKSDMAADQLGMQQALQRGDMQTAQMYATKMRMDGGTLQVARNSGIRQELGPDGQWSIVNPEAMTSGVGNTIAPMQGATQTREALAAATARGEAQGQVQEVTDKDGNKYYVPRSALLGGARAPGGAAAPAAGSPGAAGAPGTTLPFAAIGPQRATLLKDQATAATAANEAYQKQAEDANLMLAQANELRSAATDFTPGKFADTRGEMLNYLNSAGLITQDEKQKLGSYQTGTKIAIQLQAAVTKQLGSREAAQVFSYMGKSIPNLTLSPDGLEKILSWTEGMARYNTARAQVAQQRYNAGDVAGVNSVRDDFISGSNPAFYILASAAPDARAEMLRSMPHSDLLLKQWAQAVKNGMAPAPNDYWQGSATAAPIQR